MKSEYIDRVLELDDMKSCRQSVVLQKPAIARQLAVPSTLFRASAAMLFLRRKPGAHEARNAGGAFGDAQLPVTAASSKFFTHIELRTWVPVLQVVLNEVSDLQPLDDEQAGHENQRSEGEPHLQTHYHYLS